MYIVGSIGVPNRTVIGRNGRGSLVPGGWMRSVPNDAGRHDRNTSGQREIGGAGMADVQVPIR